MFVWILVALVCLWLIYSYLTKGRKCDAPGPTGLPILGYGPFIGSEAHVTFQQLSKQYGDVCLVQMGMDPTVVLNGQSAIREAFCRQEFNSRPANLFIFDVYNRYGGTFTFRQNDTLYAYMRKCAAKALAIFTNSDRSQLSQVCSAGFAKLKTIIDAKISEPINLRETVRDMTIYIMGNLSFGNQFEDDSHPFFKSYKDWVQEENKAGAHSEIAASIPFLKPFFYRSQKRFETITEEVMRQQKELVKNHKKRADGQICDIQDALDAMADVKQDLNIRSKIGVTTADIKDVGLDLFGAGFATTAEHLLMSLAVISLHTDVQEKLYEELVNLLGVGGQVLPEHLGQLQYFQAFQHELLRFFSHVPLGLHHATAVDVNFRGFFIPKGTTVLANLYSVHYDPHIFPNPTEFKPERFLSADGSVNNLHENLVAFGVGQRKCPAEVLAKQELFMVTAKLISYYKIKLHWYDADKPLQCDIGLTLNAKNFTCLFEKRG